MKENIWENPKLIEVLKNGGVAVMPTDTIYGVVGLALNQDTVKRIYEIKKRNPEKLHPDPRRILRGEDVSIRSYQLIHAELEKPQLSKRKWGRKNKSETLK